MKQVYLKGVNVVVGGFSQNDIYIPVRSARMQPESSFVTITDVELNQRFKIDWVELTDDQNNTFATIEDAINYLTEFIGSFKKGGGGSSEYVTKNELTVAGTEQTYNDLIANRDPNDYLGKYFVVQEGSNGVLLFGRRFYGNDPGLYLSTGTSWVLRRDIDGSDIIINTTNLSYSDSLELRNVLEDLDIVIEEIQESKTISSTQWRTTIAPFSVPNGFFINLFDFLDDSQKSPGGTTSYDEYSITNDGFIIVPYVGKPYEGKTITHQIRVNFDINTGSRQNCRLELRRAIDDSVIGSGITVSRNPDEPGVQEIFLTYTSNVGDAFVTGGFYIAFVNQSGANITISGNVGLLIRNTFEEISKF